MKMGQIRTLLLAVITVCVLPFAWIWVQKQADEFRKDQELSSMLRSLRAVDSANQRVMSHVDQDSEQSVKRHFPWLQQNNTLPNFFLASTGERSRYHRDAIVVLMHEPLDLVGGAVSSCFRSLASGRGLSVAPPMSFANRKVLDSGNFSKSVFKFKDRFGVYHGRYTFGLCDRLSVSCAYVPVFREPLSAAVSSYAFCKENPQDDVCGDLDANKVSLRDWIIHHGSPLFRHLVTSLDSCKNGTYEVNATDRDPGPSEEFLCRDFHRLAVESHGEITIVSAVNYIVKNLQSWFSVVGLAEDVKTTLRVLEHLYRLPLESCVAEVEEQMKDVNGVSMVDNSGHSDANLRRNAEDWFEEDDPKTLAEDLYVIRALEPDTRIYKEAKRLFSIQRQMITNSVV